jgi:NADH:ubiquinone reductase (H+-translocating)
MSTQDAELVPLHRVVIVGAGFAGLSAAQALAHSPVEITLVDRRNFHLFQPLLYQVATAGLNPSDIAWPIRSILRSQVNVKVILGEVCEVSATRQTVSLADGRSLKYDWLILATGATHTYFGHNEWSSVAGGLKRIDDATLLRRRILLAFERAETATTPAERERLLTFVVIGGGPTGVELAGALAELSRKTLASDFRSIDPDQTRILLVESGPRLLPTFPEELSAVAAKELRRMGVEVWTSCTVSSCDPLGITASGKRQEAGTILWAAGVAASPASRWIGATADRAGRAVVDEHLRVPGIGNIFVIGDTAAVTQDGKPVPGIAPAAKQQGRHAAYAIGQLVRGRPLTRAFRYRHYGSLATIGRHSAVIDFGKLRLRGWVAWWIWGFAHIYFLIGARNRLLVAVQWFFSYLTYGRGARLIVGSDSQEGARPRGDQA